MQASEHDAPGGSPREHEFSDLEERISEAEVPLDDEPLLEAEPRVQDDVPVARRSQPPAAAPAAAFEDVPDEAQTKERISYFEQAQAEAYRQNPISAFAEEHAAALAKAHGQSRYEQAWAEWDRQFEGHGQAPTLASAVEPTGAGRSRLLVPGVALAALVGLGAAAYQLVIVPGQQQDAAATTPAAPQEKAPAVEAQAAQGEAAQGEAAQRAADEAIARADEAARAAQGTPAEQAAPSRAAEEPQARVAPTTDEESPEARRERIREEKRAARREARHRRRDEKRAAELAEQRAERAGTKVSASSSAAAAADDEEEEADDGETVIEPEPVKKKKGAATRSEKQKKSGEDSDDPLYGLE